MSSIRFAVSVAGYLRKNHEKPLFISWSVEPVSSRPILLTDICYMSKELPLETTKLKGNDKFNVY